MKVTLDPLPMKEAAQFWKNKVHLSPGQFAKLSDEAKVMAFGVSGIAKGDQLTTVYNAIQKAIEQGTSFSKFKNECREIFERRGWTGKRDWRVQNIFRTNIQTAYNSGQYKRQKEMEETFPYLQYSAINDRRTRPTHKAMDGMVFPVDHQFWNTWYPPNGYRCRCTTLSLSDAQVNRMGLSVETEDPTDNPIAVPSAKTGAKINTQQLLPDPGFEYHPGKVVWQGVLDGVTDRLEKWPAIVSLTALNETVGGPLFTEWYREPSGDFPVGLLSAADAVKIDAKSRTALLSPDTVVKQRKHHPELGADEYQKIQQAIGGGHAIQDGARSLVYILDTEPGYVTVVKSTVSGKAVFVTSFRRLSNDEARRDKEVSRLLKKRKR